MKAVPFLHLNGPTPSVATLTALELAAGGLIAISPSCPPWSSRLVDQLTIRRDRALGVEVVL